MDIKQECYSSDSYDSVDNSTNNEVCFETDVKSEPFATVFLEEPYSSIDDNAIEGIKEELDIKEEPTSPFDHFEIHHLEPEIFTKHQIFTKHLTCYICDFTTTQKSAYNTHMTTHPQLQYKFTNHSFSSTQKHVEGYSKTSKLKLRKEKLFDCSYCPCKFTSRASLTRHLKSNNSGAVLTCNLCDYKADSKCMLKFHMEKTHLCSKPVVRAKGLLDTTAKQPPVELSLIGLIVPKSPVKDKLNNLPDDIDYSIAYLLFQMPRATTS